MQNPCSSQCFLIEDWLVSPSENLMQRGEHRVILERKAMNVLCHLCEHAGEVVGIEALLTHCWRGEYPGDNVVHKNIAILRKNLGEQGRHSRYIETIPKRGYRLRARVRPVPDTNSHARLQQRMRRVRALLHAIEHAHANVEMPSAAYIHRLRRHNAWLLRISRRLLDQWSRP